MLEKFSSADLFEFVDCTTRSSNSTGSFSTGVSSRHAVEPIVAFLVGEGRRKRTIARQRNRKSPEKVKISHDAS